MEPYEPHIVFAGQTESGRIATAELFDKDGETLIVTKVFQPIPEDWGELGEDKDEGLFPGGSWKIIPKAEDAEKGGALFKAEGYTLQYALWLMCALAAGIKASKQFEQLKGKTTYMAWVEGEKFEDTPIESLLDEQAFLS